MGHIEKISKIRRDILSSEQYFQTILEQAYGSGLLSQKTLEKIQMDCLALLAKKVERYNSGESSSIPVEAAQSLLASIVFILGVWLKTFANPDEAVAELQNKDLFSLYEKGWERVEEMVKATKALHTSLVDNLVQTENVFYGATLVDGIKGFFKLYNPEFAAQEVHITADYPVHQRIEPLEGIEFIQKYLEYLYYENLFCVQFSKENLHGLLYGYSEDYRECLFNIYEPVLTTAMGCMLCGRNVYSLELTAKDLHELSTLFCGKSKSEIVKILMDALDKLSLLMTLGEPLKKYLTGSLPLIAASIENSVQQEILSRVFIISKYPENHGNISYSYGAKMDDEAYRKILEEFKQCRYLADKKVIIKTEIHSLADLEDVLLDGELCEDEMLSILGDLSPVEVAALVKKYPIPSDDQRDGIRESELKLSHCLEKLIAALPEHQRVVMREIVKNIKLEDAF